MHLTHWLQQGQGTLVVVGPNADVDAMTLLHANERCQSPHHVIECCVGLPVFEA